MESNYLTKSDFRVAPTCPTKLYYRKLGYPTHQDNDEYLSLLADQGYVVEALARRQWPEGRCAGFLPDVEQAAANTLAALADDPTVFEATFICRGRLARVDILHRRGDRLELIETSHFRSIDRVMRNECAPENRVCSALSP